jgi:HTH-type transcriptional regulator / antitoxin HipB
MTDLQDFIKHCKDNHPSEFANFDEEYGAFKVGVMLKQARSEAGLTQEQVAKMLKTTKSAISRIENHANDIRLSTLEKFAFAIGKRLSIAIE